MYRLNTDFQLFFQEKQYTCTDCDNKYCHKQSLVAHKNAAHGLREFKCIDCSINQTQQKSIKTDNSMTKIKKSSSNSPSTTQKTKNWATQTAPKIGGELRCSGRVSSSCSHWHKQKIYFLRKYFALKFCLFVDRHVCEKCGKRYKSIPGLTDHQARHHETTRYTCGQWNCS
jgi:hypothetical protein